MRLLLEDIIQELKLKISETKSIRSRGLLQRALDSLNEFKQLNEKKL